MYSFLKVKYLCLFSNVSYQFYDSPNDSYTYTYKHQQSSSDDISYYRIPWFFKEYHFEGRKYFVGMNCFIEWETFYLAYSERIFSLIIWITDSNSVRPRPYLFFYTWSLQIHISSKRFKKIFPSVPLSIHSGIYCRFTFHDIDCKIGSAS